MRFGRRAAALGCLAGVGFVAFGALDATAAPPQQTEQTPQPTCSDNPALWGCVWNEGFVDGMAFDGDTITLSGTFRPPFGEISHIEAVLRPETVSDRCPAAEVSHDLTGDDTTTTTPTTQPGDGTVDFSLEGIVPLCNDVYGVEVRAYTAPAGPEETEGESPPLELHGVRVALRPPSPVGPLVVEWANQPGALVKLRWSAPEAYATATPPGFLGYRVERALGSGPFETIETTVATSMEDQYTGWAGEGTYRYRVVTVRKESDVVDSAILLTSPPEHAPLGEVLIQAQPTTTSPPATTGTPTRGGGGGSGGRSGGVPVGGTVAADSGFSETLDYSDFEFGSEEAVPPEDATSFIELEDGESPGSPVARPIAVASVLAMWAFHLRYLSRRADLAS